eukprot:scaffold11063_cov167-Amphora_coffeaeformis.AAC.3
MLPISTNVLASSTLISSSTSKKRNDALRRPPLLLPPPPPPHVPSFLLVLLLLFLFFFNSATVWGGADCLFLHRGALDDDNPYLKSAVLHQWIFSYELPDTIIVLTKGGDFYMLATKKKCDFIRPAADQLQKKASSIQNIHLLVRNKDDGNAENYDRLWKASGLDQGKQQI